MRTNFLFSRLLLFCLLFTLSCKKDTPGIGKTPGILQLVSVKAGTVTLNLQGGTKDIPIDKGFMIEFNSSLDTSTVRNSFYIKKDDNSNLIFDATYLDNFKSIVLNTRQPLANLTNYSFQITAGIKGLHGETFPGVVYQFTTINGKLTLISISLNGSSFLLPVLLKNIDYKKINIELLFSHAIDSSNYKSFFTLSGSPSLSFSLTENNKKVTIINNGDLKDYTHYYFSVSSNLTASNGFLFDGFSNSFYTSLDSSLKYPIISDEALLDLIQKQTFRYFWDFAHPSCGLARERNTSGEVVTIGGSGFGVMALIVGIQREFITRSDGLTRLDKILGFLETCDRFHGAWPHWLNGATGKTVPYSPIDDGGDLVETSFMIQGLLTMRQYLDSTISREKNLIDRINSLSDSVEYDWFTKGQNVLYWHWSPNTGWLTNVKLEGYNETLITYVLAASSATHSVSADAYKSGYTRNGSIINGNTYYGYVLPLGQAYGGPLFFTHYSFLGMDPRRLQDAYANYWEQNVNQSLINWAYCTDNPKKYIGYSSVSWGLTASDNPWGYSAHSPTHDLGVITPTAAISSIPYTPKQSMDAIRHFYYILGDRLWGEYGFYDAFDVTEGWWANSYISIDQGPIICMIENYRTNLLWNLFMSNPEVKKGLTKLGFTY